METGTLSLTIQDVNLRLAYLHRPGARAPLVCLHGFGSTKEEYADLALWPDFADRELLLLDAPGCGASEIDDLNAISIPFLVETAIAACDAMDVQKFHLSGHSMGGLTALMLAHTHPDRVLSFIDIEGNVAPEDCFLSRQIVDHPADTPQAFLDGFIARVGERDEYASRFYTNALPHKVRAEAVAPIFTSMVELSDNLPLMDMMANLPCPRVFIYGEQNCHLSYLGHLPKIGVEVVEIAHSGHFPMYSNAPALWAVMHDFLERSEPFK